MFKPGVHLWIINRIVIVGDLKRPICILLEKLDLNNAIEVFWYVQSQLQIFLYLLYYVHINLHNVINSSRKLKQINCNIVFWGKIFHDTYT